MTPSDYDVINGPFPTWPNPNSSDAAKIDDLWHASVNGRGLFFNASNPQELVDAMLTVMSSIEARTGSAASVSVNGDELYETVGSSILMYQTSYFSDGWGGDVKAYNIDSDGSVITEPIAWSANDRMESFLTNFGFGSRVIATYDGASGTPFEYASLTSAQQATLSSGSVTGQQMLNYIRGDDSLEEENGGSLRTRYYALGDFVHSSATFNDGILYAGSNDGMLHAFDATTGSELFAYTPGLVFANLPNLADPAYSHNYFVDLAPYVKKMGGTTFLVGGLGKGGKGYYSLDITDPLLINTEATLSSRVNWEFPASFDADMGYSFSKAFIVKTGDSTLNSGTDLEGYVVIFGNGYQSPNGKAILYVLNPLNGAIIRKIDTGAASCNGLSSPVPVDVDNDSNVDYVYAGDLLGHLWKFDLRNADPSMWGVAYGTDGSGNGVIDAAETGDVPQPLFTARDHRPITTRPDVMFQCGSNQGYLVIFGTGKYLSSSDLTDTSQQTLYGIWDYGDDDDNSESLGLFDPSASPALSNQPVGVDLLEQTVDWEGTVSQNAAGDTITSQYLRTLSDNPINRLVKQDADSGQMPNPGILGIDSDNFDNNLDGSKDEAAEVDALAAYTSHLGWATDLADNDADGVIDGAEEKRAENITKSHAGWYFDLPISKERISVDPMIRDNKVIAISYVPQATPCTGGGYSIVHELNACTGGRMNEATIDVNGDGAIDDKDLINIVVADHDHPGQTKTITVAPTGKKYSGRLQPPAILRNVPREIKYFSSSAGTIKTMSEKAEQRGMYYWRENRN
jgi:Tfp pilus tip-associated adhesin PilY1